MTPAPAIDDGNVRIHARAEAFAAIRRAAEVAREREAQGDDLWDRGFPHFAHPQYNKARDIRRAIRAAIGSDKA